MGVLVTFNGNQYLLPTTSETGWSTVVTNFLLDVANNTVTSTATQTLSNKTLRGPAGTAAAPTFSFAGDPDTGIYQAAVGQLNLATNGTVRLSMAADGTITLNNGASLASPTISTPAITGGTITSATLATPTVTTPAITGGTITNTAHSGGTIASATLSSCTSSTALPVGGTGVSYTGVTGTGAGHTHAWGWTGSQLQAWVDGSNVGNVAFGSFLPLTGGTLSGALTATGAIRSPQFIVNASGGYVFADPTYCYYVQDGANWQWRYTRANGRMAWVRGSDGAELFAVDGSGNASHASSVTTAGNYYCQTLQAASSVFAATDNSFGLYTSGTNRIHQYQPNWYWGWDTGTGQLNWVANASVFWVMRPSDSLCYNNLGKVAGHGAYADLSDANMKTDMVEADHGLDHILALQPKTFRRKSRRKDDDSYSDRTELGFVAQDVQQVLPEAVTDLKLDGEDRTTLAVSTTPIIAALVNSVKALTARIAELEARAK